MLFFRKDPALWSYVVAIAVAIGLPMALGYAIFAANPSACYDSPCAVPLLLMVVPRVAAPSLAVLFAINRRFEKRVPDGWLPTILISSVLGQIGISLLGVLAASPNIRDIFFSDILFLPEGLFVGLVVGAVFWVALHAFGRKAIVT